MTAYPSGNYKRLKEKEKSRFYVMDAGYKIPALMRELIRDGKVPVMPYKNPLTKKGYFKKHEYVYDEPYDCYICPIRKY